MHAFRGISADSSSLILILPSLPDFRHLSVGEIRFADFKWEQTENKLNNINVEKFTLRLVIAVDFMENVWTNE